MILDPAPKLPPSSFPLRIHSVHPGDALTIRELTRGKAGGPPNSFETLRSAAGVCLDIRRRLVDTNATILDRAGLPVAEELWLAEIREARGR